MKSWVDLFHLQKIEFFLYNVGAQKIVHDISLIGCLTAHWNKQFSMTGWCKNRDDLTSKKKIVFWVTNMIISIMAQFFCYLCKLMFSNSAMWNTRLFPEPVGANIKKSRSLANPSTLSFDYCNFVEGNSRFVYVHFLLSFLPCLHFKAKCLPENWPVNDSALQVRKVCFLTYQHLTTRNWKQALRKSTY